MRMRDVVPADYVSIAIVDRNAPAMVRIYTRDQRDEGGLELERCAFSREDTGRAARLSRTGSGSIARRR